MFTLSSPSEVHGWVTILPAVLNTLSDCVLGADMHRLFRAMFDSGGKRFCVLCHRQ